MKRKLKILASLLLWHKGSLLLLRRSRNFKGLSTGIGLWELPGGGVQFGRTLRGTAIRELEEETGLLLKRRPRFETLLVYSVRGARTVEHRIAALYQVKFKGHLTDHILLGAEHDDYKLVHRAKELERLDMAPALREYLAKVLK